MLTFKNFLGEQDMSNITATEAANKIWNDCKFYLDEVGFNPNDPSEACLYRGISSASLPMFSKIYARTDRQPLNTKKAIHDVLDNYFLDNFGFRFRSAGTFTVGNRLTAAHYGSIHAIFPIGKFKYAWSGTISDAYVEFEGAGGLPGAGPEVIKYATKMGLPWPSPPQVRVGTADSQLWVDSVELYLKHHPGLYQDDALREVAHRAGDFNEHEVMLGCESYYAILFERGINDEDQQFIEELFHELSLLMRS